MLDLIPGREITCKAIDISDIGMQTPGDQRPPRRNPPPLDIIS